MAAHKMHMRDERNENKNEKMRISIRCISIFCQTLLQDCGRRAIWTPCAHSRFIPFVRTCIMYGKIRSPYVCQCTVCPPVARVICEIARTCYVVYLPAAAVINRLIDIMTEHHNIKSHMNIIKVKYYRS